MKTIIYNIIIKAHQLKICFPFAHWLHKQSFSNNSDRHLGYQLIQVSRDDIYFAITIHYGGARSYNMNCSRRGDSFPFLFATAILQSFAPVSGAIANSYRTGTLFPLFSFCPVFVDIEYLRSTAVSPTDMLLLHPPPFLRFTARNLIDIFYYIVTNFKWLICDERNVFFILAIKFN